MNIKYAIRDFFFPPVCPGCGEVFAAKYGELNELCPECDYEWVRKKFEICRVCGERFSDCRCVPRALEHAGAAALIKLVPYNSHRTVSNNVILYIKRHRDARVIGFLSRELSSEIEKYIKKLGIRKESAVIAYCPRRRAAVNKLGFDQARLIAEGLSINTGIPVSHAICRATFFSRSQKKLGVQGRAKNVKGAFALSRKADVKNKTVFIVDDLVTTGSTMSECVRVLKKSGAALVVGVSVAYTPR
ncbi:MAG: ComF family protein [Ruminococcaceae bacterium]|nr:ComF family protein [Oscillospiraceae bacterium]